MQDRNQSSQKEEETVKSSTTITDLKPDHNQWSKMQNGTNSEPRSDGDEAKIKTKTTWNQILAMAERCDKNKDLEDKWRRWPKMQAWRRQARSNKRCRSSKGAWTISNKNVAPRKRVFEELELTNQNHTIADPPRWEGDEPWRWRTERVPDLRTEEDDWSCGGCEDDFARSVWKIGKCDKWRKMSSKNLENSGRKGFKVDAMALIQCWNSWYAEKRENKIR